jgi:hypothetical protein
LPGRRGVFRSANGGDSWEDVNVGLPGGASQNGGAAVRISSLGLCTSPQSQSTFLIAGTDQGVFRSDDLGAFWMEIATGFLDKSVQAMAAGPHGELVIATPVTGFVESDWPDFHIVENQLDLDLSQAGIIPGSWIVLRQRRRGGTPLMRLLHNLPAYLSSPKKTLVSAAWSLECWWSRMATCPPLTCVIPKYWP